jgi:hypothetical protein
VQIFGWARLFRIHDRQSKSELFKDLHFEQEIIVRCVRWYLRYKLFRRDLVKMMVERCLLVDHTTLLRRVRRYMPDFNKYWSRFPSYTGRSFRVDDTYVRICGQWILSLPDCRLIGQDGRLSAYPRAQRRLDQSVFSQSDRISRSCPRNRHAGRLCCFSLGYSRPSAASKACRFHETSLIKTPEQHDRARPSNVTARLGSTPGLISFESATTIFVGSGSCTRFTGRSLRTCLVSSSVYSVGNLGKCPGYPTYRSFTSTSLSAFRDLHQSTCGNPYCCRRSADGGPERS